jgi:hypothetical protein
MIGDCGASECEAPTSHENSASEQGFLVSKCPQMLLLVDT